ncbi:hypothetical protein [Streptomyces sp. NPDC057702]|uniref:hypothetical protein n=1 Tax=unclassified Streptomyces TaxID=2593676 RepID=UPI00368E893C
MTGRQVRVTLLVWRPRDPARPGDLAAGWPHVLQVRDGGGPWQVPSVLLRPGEHVTAAAGRVSDALGLTPPNAHRVLAVDQQPLVGSEPEELTIIADGGWVTDDDVSVAPATRCPRDHACRHAHRHGVHRRRWAGTAAVVGEVALAAALGAAVAAIPAFIVRRGGDVPGGGPVW